MPPQERWKRVQELSEQAEPLRAVFSRAAMPAKVGPYTITGILGQGGMGIVYAAEIERAGEVQQVALKLIQTHLDEPEHAARFTREQKILARLDHPGITRLLDAGVSDENQP